MDEDIEHQYNSRNFGSKGMYNRNGVNSPKETKS